MTILANRPTLHLLQLHVIDDVVIGAPRACYMVVLFSQDMIITRRLVVLLHTYEIVVALTFYCAL